MVDLNLFPWERPALSETSSSLGLSQVTQTDDEARVRLAELGYSIDYSDEMLGQQFFGAQNDALLTAIPDAHGVCVPCVSLIKMHQLRALGRQTSNIVSALRIARDYDRSLIGNDTYYLVDRTHQPSRHKMPSGGWVTMAQDGLRVDKLVGLSNFLLQGHIPKLGPERVSILANFCLAAAEVWNASGAEDHAADKLDMPVWHVDEL
jgi:hypothetical protein